MSQSTGPGSPVAFRCHRERDSLRSVKGEHRIRLTGRQRRYRVKKYSALGIRSDLVSRQYVCSCGHVGWSNHVDLARLAGEKPRSQGGAP